MEMMAAAVIPVFETADGVDSFETVCHRSEAKQKRCEADLGAIVAVFEDVARALLMLFMVLWKQVVVY